jgi:hypothetical protein
MELDTQNPNVYTVDAKKKEAEEKRNRLSNKELRLEKNTEQTAFWVVAPCSLVEVYRRFRDACCLHLQGKHKFRGRGNVSGYYFSTHAAFCSQMAHCANRRVENSNARLLGLNKHLLGVC